MKKSFIGLFCALMAFHANAQDKPFMFGFNASLDWNSYALIDDLGVTDFQGTLNYSSGITVRKYLSPRLTVSGALNYATRNFREYLDYSKFRFLEPIDPSLIEGPTYTYKNGFIDIPVTVAYSIVSNDKLEIFPSAGIVNSVLIHEKMERAGEESPEHRPLKYNRYLIATQIGFGLLFKQETFGILIEPQARVYATQAHNRGPEQNPFQLGLSASFLWWKQK
ncbi:outer membrane beta-barrel protein [Fulvivirgaceae bacterium PWU4]|uniref:Outer membrane beta-barrel protein n=1 Tax=Chryseosolibacter histidini TaxID=2782349 RepID=A0AAP2GNC2_9BACT|nr:outer membrane beta-barrel protein [Chryseosolibacter histidini]MBT1697868.1 outer membrane beta-barrel protein [Chryseosolibacter histidini]